MGSEHSPALGRGEVQSISFSWMEPALGGDRHHKVDPEHLASLVGVRGATAWRQSVDYVLDNGLVRGYALKLTAVIAATHHEHAKLSLDHRIMATRALEAFGDEVATQALVDLLSDRTAWWVGQYAMDALTAIGFAATSLLLPSLVHYDPVVRRRVAQVLGEIRDPAAIQHLLERLSVEEQPWVRACTVRALGSFAYRPAVVAALQDALTDADRLVRQYARESLSQA